MPQHNQGRPSRAHASTRSTPRVAGRSPERAAAPGSRSPKHRGYRPDEADAAPKKARWSRDERVERGLTADRSRGAERP